jgi:hypothetical protein
MSILVIGPWILLVAGIGILAAAVYRAFLADPSRFVIGFLAFLGVLLCGLAVYGPAFLADYAKFLKEIQPLLNVAHSATPKEYQALFRAVGDGDLPAEYQELGLAYTLDRPVPAMEQLLDNAIGTATNPAGKQALEKTRQALAGKQNAARLLIAELAKSKQPIQQALEDVDPATRTLVADVIQRTPPDKLKELNIDPKSVHGFLAPRQSRALP